MLLTLSLAFLSLSADESHDLTWVTPENSAWQSIPLTDDSDVPFEVSWTDESDDPHGFIEYCFDDPADDGQWQRFPGYDRVVVRREGYRRYYKGIFRSNSFKKGKRGYVRGRWSNGKTSGRPRAAFYNRGGDAGDPPAVEPRGGTYRVPRQRDDARAVPAPRFARIPLHVRSGAPLASVSSRVGRTGAWKHSADVVPGSDITVDIPASDFPAAQAGEVIPVEFKAFDGIHESAATEPLNVVVNHPPVLSADARGDPVIGANGHRVELPFHVSDADGDSVTLFYRFDDRGAWTEAPAGDAPNVLPGSAFAALDPRSDHTMRVLAFDGYDESAAVPLFWGAIAKHIGGRLLGSLFSHAPGRLSVLPAADLAGVPLRAQMASLTGDAFGVSYSVDWAPTWSDVETYPLGEHAVFVFGGQAEPYLQPGEHSIRFRFQDDAGSANEESVEYVVNARPALLLTDEAPLSFREAPTNAVVLPIAVSDDNDDPVRVFYRFEGEDMWAQVPTVNGAHVLPADGFEGHLDDGGGTIELFAWDGLEKSTNVLKVGYSVGADAGEAERPEQAQEPVGEASPAGGGLAVGLSIGGVAVVALALGIAIFATRNKAESNSGFVEE